MHSKKDGLNNPEEFTEMSEKVSQIDLHNNEHWRTARPMGLSSIPKIDTRTGHSDYLTTSMKEDKFLNDAFDNGGEVIISNNKLLFRGANNRITVIGTVRVVNGEKRIYKSPFAKAFIKENTDELVDNWAKQNGYIVWKEDFGNSYEGGGSLTPEQYELVRTPAFKNWFGDWENNPEGASKVVDENGEPLKQSHFTNSKFTVFKNKETGFHFGDKSIKEDLSIAKGEDLFEELEVFLNIRNPLRVKDSHRFDPSVLIEQLSDDNVITGEQYDKLSEDLYDAEENLTEDDYYDDWALINKQSDILIKVLKGLGYDGLVYQNKFDSQDSKLAYLIDEDSSQIYVRNSEGIFVGDVVLESKSNKRAIVNFVSHNDNLYVIEEDNGEELTELNKIRIKEIIDSGGYVKVLNSPKTYTDIDLFLGEKSFLDSWVAFDSEQIKLADGSNTTFDENNPDIRFNDGGSAENEVYIDFLNKEKNFTKDKKSFKTYEDAEKWARKNIDKFNPDMIHYYLGGGSTKPNPTKNMNHDNLMNRSDYTAYVNINDYPYTATVRNLNSFKSYLNRKDEKFTPNVFGEITYISDNASDEWVYELSKLIDEKKKELQTYYNGGMTRNEQILESFLTSNKNAKVNNLSTHYAENENQILLRNYGTLIAIRKGNDVKITSKRYSVTTSKIQNALERMAKSLLMNVSRVDEFEAGGQLDSVSDMLPHSEPMGVIQPMNIMETVQPMYAGGGGVNDDIKKRYEEYREREIAKQEEEEKGKTFKTYIVNVYEQKKSGGYPFTSHETDNFLEAVDFGKAKMTQQRRYRSESDPLWVSISKFVPIRKRGNVLYPYNDLIHYNEKDLEYYKNSFDAGGRTTFEIEKDDSDYSDGFYKMLEKQREQELIVKMKIATIIGIDSAIELIDSDFVINPFNLIQSAVRKGFIDVEQINKALIDASQEEAYHIDSDYRDSGHGIGSSDMNAFISSMLRSAGIQEKDYANGGGVGSVLVYEYKSQNDYEQNKTIKEMTFDDFQEADTFAREQSNYKNKRMFVVYNIPTSQYFYYGIGKTILEKGGALKPIPEGNKGLPKLPKEVRNRMGYMNHGGMTQGYNDRMDESLGMRHRGHHSQSHKDRRDEAKGMNKGMGNRAYQSVGSMDKMNNGGVAEKRQKISEERQMKRTVLNDTTHKLINKNGSDINKYSEYDLKTLKSYISERDISEKMAQNVWGLAIQNGFEGYLSKVLIINSGTGNILNYVDDEFNRVDAVNPDKTENIIAGLLNDEECINIYTDSLKTLNKYDLAIILDVDNQIINGTKRDSLKLVTNKLNPNNLLIFVTIHLGLNPKKMIQGENANTKYINNNYRMVSAFNDDTKMISVLKRL